MLPLLEELDPEERRLALLPLGPLELTPEGRHWYAIEREASPEPETFLPVLDALCAWLDATLGAHGIPLSRTVVGGFSQGAVMAYAVSLAPARRSPAALLVFSGYIPRVAGWDLEIDGRGGVAISITHGTHDDVVSVTFAREARDRLTAARLPVRYGEEPVGHTITAGALEQARAVIDASLRPSR